MIRVDRLERSWRHVRVQAEDLKEQSELVFLYVAVCVGVDCAEEEWQWTGKSCSQSGVSDLLLERRNERLLVDGLTLVVVLQVLLPDLQQHATPPGYYTSKQHLYDKHYSSVYLDVNELCKIGKII